MSQYVQVPIGSLPVNLITLDNGDVAFVTTSEFKAIIDLPSEDDNVGAYFDKVSFSIGDMSFSYSQRYNYKDIPVMLQWLKQQGLQSPFGQ